MGQIIIANMQASLTLDSRQFDQELTIREQRLAAVDQKASGLPQDQRANVGTANDPEQQKRQVRQQADAQDVAAHVAATERASAAVAQSAALEVTAVQKVGQAHADVAQKIMTNNAQVAASLDNVVAKANALTDTLTKAVGLPATVPVTKPLATPAPASIATTAPAAPVSGGATLTTDPRAIENAKLMVGKTGGSLVNPSGTANVAAVKNVLSGTVFSGDSDAQFMADSKAWNEAHGIGDWESSPDNVMAVNPNRANKKKTSYANAAPVGEPVVSRIDVGELREVPPEILAGMRKIAQTAPDDYASKMDDVQKYLEDAQKTTPFNLYSALSQYTDIGEQVQKDNTPEGKKRTQLAEMKAQINTAKGLPADPLDRQLVQAQQRLAKLTGPEEEKEPSDTAVHLAQHHAQAGVDREHHRTALFGLVPLAERGREESLAYQRYQVLESPVLGTVNRALEPTIPAISNILQAISGPELAAAAAATAFGEALHMATEATSRYNESTFQLTEQNQSRALGQGGAGTAFFGEQRESMLKLGVNGTEENGLLSDITRYTQNKDEIARVQKEAVDFARTFGTTIQQAQGLIVGASQGNAGALHQYIPSIYQGDTFKYAEQQIGQVTAGAGAAFMDTSAGASAKLSADWDEMLVNFGEKLVPTADAITKSLDNMIPVADGAGKAISFISEAMGDLGRIVGIGTTAIGKLIPGMDDMWTKVDRGLDVVHTKSQAFLDFINQGSTRTELEKTVGLDKQNGQWGKSTDTFAGVGVTSDYQLTYDQRIAKIADANVGIGGKDTGQEIAGYTAPKPTIVPDMFGRAAATLVPPSADEIAKARQSQLDQNALRAKYGSDAAIQQAAISGNLDDNLKVVKPVPMKVDLDHDSRVNGGTSGGDLGNSLADTAAARVSSMRTIAEETSDTENAITGIQKVYGQLQTFHVDFTQVQANLDNLEGGIEYLQKFWVKVANSQDSGIVQHEYDITKTWLDMVGSMVGVMGQTTDVMQKIYLASGEMPDQSQINAVLSRSELAFEAVNKVAEVQMKGVDAGQQTVKTATVQAWATSMSALMSFMGLSSDVMGKIFSTPMPDDARVQEAADKSVGVVAKFSKALNDKFTKMDGDKVVIDSGLANAASQATSATTILAFAGQGVALFQAMTDLYVPSDAEIDTAVARVMSTADKVEAAILKQMNSRKGTGDTLNAAAGLGLPGLSAIKTVTAGASDPTMKAAADTAKNEQAIMGLAMTGVQTLAAMRNLSVPSPAEIDHIIGGVFVAINDAIAHLPAQNPEQQAKVKAWGEAYAPMMSAVSSGVDVMAKLRDLAEPTVGMIKVFRARMQTVEDEFTDLAMSVNKEQTDKMADWGNGMGAMMGALVTGADMLQKVRDLPEPSVKSLSDFKTKMNEAIGDFMPTVRATSQAATDDAKDWGNGMGAMFGALSSGADYLNKITGIFIPTHEQMDKVWDAQSYLSAKAINAAQHMGPDLAKSVKEYGDSMTSAFGGINAGATAIVNIANQPAIGQDMIDTYFKNLDSVFTGYEEGMDRWVARAAFENAKYAPEVGDELTALTSGTDFLFKLGSLKPDYSNAIRGYFSQLTLVWDEWATQAPRWSAAMQPINDKVAATMKGEGDALTASLTPLTMMNTASLVRPEQIEYAFSNIDAVLGKFQGLMDKPSLQGEKLTKLHQFSGVVGEIFGDIKTTIDAVDALNEPSQEEGSSNFGGYLQNFFENDVPRWGQIWADTMGGMADASAGMASTVLNNTGALPMNGASGNGKIGSTGVVRGSGMVAGGAPTYNNCLILNDAVIGEGSDVAALIKKLTANSTVAQGGVPTGTRK